MAMTETGCTVRTEPWFSSQAGRAPTCSPIVGFVNHGRDDLAADLGVSFMYRATEVPHPALVSVPSLTYWRPSF